MPETDTAALNAGKWRIASNLIIMGSGTIFTWAISTLYLVLMSRYLQSTRQGEFSRAGNAVALLGLVLSLGVETYVTRTVARAPERAPALVAAALIMRGVLVLPLLVIVVLYTHLTPHLSLEERIVTYILYVGVVVNAFGSPLLAVFQGREQMSLNAIASVVQNVFELMLIIAIILLRGGVVAFAVATVAMSVVQLILTLRWATRVSRFTSRPTIGDIRELIGGGLAFWGGSFIAVFYTYIDSLILGALSGDNAVGLYAAALRLLGVPFFLPGIIGTITLPLLSRLGVALQSDYVRVARKTLTLLILSAVPLAIGTATFASPLILTIFGHSYANAVPTLQVLALIIPPTFLNTQFYQILVARDQQWRWMTIMVVCCVVNPLLNLTLIPYAAQRWHNAALGAAWSLVATEVIMVAYGIIVLREIMLNRAIGRTVAGSLAGGLAQGLAIWLTASLSLWPIIGQALALVAFCIVALALGALARDDVAFLWITILGNLRRVRARLALIRTRSSPLAKPPDTLL